MRAYDLPVTVGSDGRKLHRRRLVDEVECTTSGTLSDFRRFELLRAVATQPDLCRLPSLGRLFESMKVDLIGGFWTIELSAKEERT